MDKNNSSVIEKLTKIKPTLFFFAVSVCETVLAYLIGKKGRQKRRYVMPTDPLKNRLKITVQLCEFVSPLTTSWINGHTCRCANHRLLSSVLQPLMSPSSENRRGRFTCACATQSKRPGPLFTAPPVQKKKEKRPCAETSVSHTFLCRRLSQRLPPPKRSGPHRHLAGAALCVYKQTQTYKKIHLQAPCEPVHCAH